MDENELEQNDFFGEKDRIIAHFQEVTGLDDIGQCLEICETANWNLDEAIHTYLTGRDIEPVVEEPSAPVEIEPEIIDVDEVERPIRPNRPHIGFNIENILNRNNDSPLQNLRFDIFNEPYRRQFEITVEYKNLSQNFFVFDTETVGQLKKYCEEHFKVPVKNQVLRGWENKDVDVNDQVQLKELGLRVKQKLYLLNNDKTDQGTSTAAASAAYVELCEYELAIKVISDESTTEYLLRFESNKRLFDVKQAIFKLNAIPINEQVLYVQIFNERHYLNDKFDDLTYLYEVKNYINIHDEKQQASNKFNLYIKHRKRIDSGLASGSNESVGVLSKLVKTNIASNTDEDAFVNVNDTDDDDDEHLFSSLITNQNELSTRPKPLMPHEYDNDYDAVNDFVSGFAERYGHLMPLFFFGTLDDAIRDSLLRPAKDRKLLGIYLHTDKTVFSNIFCSKVLCDEAVINFLSNNFIVWPWDLTVGANEAKFYDYCNRNFGTIAVNTLKNFKNKLPVFLIVTRARASNEIISIIEGGSTKEQMLNNLMHACELFETQRMKDEHDEQQREERENIKREQDFAYQQSLVHDKAKKQKQEEELKQAEEKRLMEERLEREKKDNFQRQKLNFQSQLPTEPSANEDKRNVSAIRLKLPSGEFVQRKFLIKHPLSSLIAFAGSLGYFTDTYKMLSSWPRRDVTLEDANKTLEELKLFPQETINIEER